MAIVPCGSTGMARLGQPQCVLKSTPASKLSASCHCVPGKMKTLASVSSTMFTQDSLCVLFNMAPSRNPHQCKGTRLNVRANNSDYYAVLGVQNGASKSDIKSAYRRLARSYHPDVNKKPDAEQTFKDISNAYEILSDDKKRSIYDKSLKAKVNGARWGMEDFSNPFEYMEFVINGMDDIDDWDSGGGGSWNRAIKGEDLLYDLVLNFKEAVFGVEKEIEVTQLNSCSTCNGSGAKPGTRHSKCTTCRGHGEVITSARTPFGIFDQVMTCSDCYGTGKTYSPCNTCRGGGRLRKSNRISLNIPAGVDSGSRLRVRGEGNVGTRGGSPGDLFVVIEVRSDLVLRRAGNNILYTCKVSYSDAILGTKMKVPTVDGMVDLKIPGGTQPGTTLVMAKKGVPFLGKRSKRGDQLVEVQVEIPRQVSGEEKKLVEEIARLSKPKS